MATDSHYKAKIGSTVCYRKSSDNPNDLSQFYREGEHWRVSKVRNYQLDKAPFFPVTSRRLYVD